MFYEAITNYKQFRFGDVLQGYVLANANYDSPFSSFPHAKYQIEISSPKYVVILTPCCTIGDSQILLCPLEEVKNSFF